MKFFEESKEIQLINTRFPWIPEKVIVRGHNDITYYLYFGIPKGTLCIEIEDLNNLRQVSVKKPSKP